MRVFFFLNTHKTTCVYGKNKTVSCPESRRFSNLHAYFRFKYSRRYCRDHAMCVECSQTAVTAYFTRERTQQEFRVVREKITVVKHC